MPKIISSVKYDVGDIIHYSQVPTNYKIVDIFYDKELRIYLYTMDIIGHNHPRKIHINIIDKMHECYKIGTVKDNPELLL